MTPHPSYNLTPFQLKAIAAIERRPGFEKICHTFLEKECSPPRRPGPINLAWVENGITYGQRITKTRAGHIVSAKRKEPA